LLIVTEFEEIIWWWKWFRIGFSCYETSGWCFQCCTDTYID